MRRAYRYRIYPDNEQQKQFLKTFGCCRFIYNRMLTDKKEWYEKHHEMLRTTPAQYKKEYEWMKEVDSLALANAQLHLEAAYRKFFREAKAGFPRYKSKRHPKQSYTTNVVNNNIRLEGKRLRLPKVGKVMIVLHRQIPAGDAQILEDGPQDRCLVLLIQDDEGTGVLDHMAVLLQ